MLHDDFVFIKGKVMKFMKILKKIGGVLLAIIGIFFFVSALKMIFVDNPKTKSSSERTQFTLMQQIRSTRKTMEKPSLYAAHLS